MKKEIVEFYVAFGQDWPTDQTIIIIIIRRESVGDGSYTRGKQQKHQSEYYQ